MKNHQENKKNVLTLGIGLFLIILVAVVIISRQSNDNAGNDKDLNSGFGGESAKYQSITSQELGNRMLDGSDLVILDARDESEFDKEHLPNSKNIRPEEAQFLDKAKTYVIVADGISQDQMNSLNEAIKKSGASDYYFLSDGFAGWKARYSPTISAGNPDSLVDQAKVTYLTSQELIKRMATEGGLLTIIDLRNKSQFDEGHIKNAVNIPLEELEGKRKSIPMGKTVIVYSNAKPEAFKAVVRLYDLGTFNALALSDGFSGWKQNKFEIEK